jgi:hypothetical protein
MNIKKTIHSDEQKELEAPSKNTNLEIWHNIKNYYWNKLLLSQNQSFQKIELESY